MVSLSLWVGHQWFALCNAVALWHVKYYLEERQEPKMTSGNHKLEAWEMTQLIKYMLCIHEDSRHPRKSLVCVCVCVRASRVETGRSQSPPTSQSSQLVSSRISERPCLKEKGMESYRGRPLALTSGAHIHVLAVCTNTYLTDTFFQKRKIVIIAVRLKKKRKE